MQKYDESEKVLGFYARALVALGLVTGRYVVTRDTADDDDSSQLADDDQDQLADDTEPRSTGQAADPRTLDRVEVDGVVWVHTGTSEPRTARKCTNPDCSACGFLPGAVGAWWLALDGPMGELADRPPVEPETAAQDLWARFLATGSGQPVTVDGGGSIRLGGRLLGVCDCPRCERGRARMSGN